MLIRNLARISYIMFLASAIIFGIKLEVFRAALFLSLAVIMRQHERVCLLEDKVNYLIFKARYGKKSDTM